MVTNLILNIIKIMVLVLDTFYPSKKNIGFLQFFDRFFVFVSQYNNHNLVSNQCKSHNHKEKVNIFY